MISKRSNTASAKGRDALCVPVQKVKDMEEVSDNWRVPTAPGDDWHLNTVAAFGLILGAAFPKADSRRRYDVANALAAYITTQKGKRS